MTDPASMMKTPVLRILHTEASCGWGGQEIRILEEMRGIAARGHHVSLICPAESQIFRRALERGYAVHALPIGRKRLPGLLALRRWLMAHPVDVINTHSSTDSWLSAIACASLPKAPPIVRTRHISAPIPRNSASRWLYNRAVCHVVTTGERLRETLVRDNGLDPERVTSIPTGIDTKRFSPASDKRSAKLALGLDPEARWVGIVATLRSWKGHLHLLDALDSIRRPELKLAIVGDGPMRQVMVDRISELRLGDRVILAGEQQAPEDWLRAFDLFCLPSYANEGIPQALMQAMLCGLPVITTPVGAITEAVSDEQTGIIVPPRDPAALAGAITRLIDDPALCRRLGDAARVDAAARFGFDQMVKRMEAIFTAAATASA